MRRITRLEAVCSMLNRGGMWPTAEQREADLRALLDTAEAVRLDHLNNHAGGSYGECQHAPCHAVAPLLAVWPLPR
jgi:hypothetical protein